MAQSVSPKRALQIAKNARDDLENRIVLTVRSVENRESVNDEPNKHASKSH